MVNQNITLHSIYGESRHTKQLLPVYVGGSAEAKVSFRVKSTIFTNYPKGYMYIGTRYGGRSRDPELCICAWSPSETATSEAAYLRTVMDRCAASLKPG
jgi:uncharacterized protein YvpB